MLEILHNIGNIVVLSSLVPLATFIILYSTKSPWRDTELGYALMFQKIAFLLVFLVIIGGLYLPDDWDLFRFISRLIVYVAVVFALWLDVVNLRRYQTNKKGLFHKEPK